MNATQRELAVPDQISEPMTLTTVKAHVHLVATILKEVMQENVHYGPSFPGDSRKNLLLPGAQKLCLTFNLVPEYKYTKTELPNGHREVEVVTSLTTRDGRLLGQGLGSCSTMESKYRWRNGQLKCPNCQKETVRRSKNEPGYYCWAKIGGCGATFSAEDEAITKQSVGKVENPDIADVYNTVLKIGAKRSLCHGLITTLALGDIFSQDAEDFAPVKPRDQEQAGGEVKSDTGLHRAVQEPAPAQAPQSTPAKKPEWGQPLLDAYTKLKGQLPVKIAECIWTLAKPEQQKLANITGTLDAIEQIRQTMGDTAGDKLIVQLAKNTGAEAGLKADVENFLFQLQRLATSGEVGE